MSNLRINSEIRVKEVRVISPDGEQMGIMSPRDAIKRAEEFGLDLVEVSPVASPPVCKIMDYGKYRYEMSKKAHTMKAAQKTAQLKEVKFRPYTDINDREIKIRKIMDFLTEGHKTKITITYKGREKAYQESGKAILVKMLETIAESCAVEVHPKIEGNTVTMTVTPKSIK